MVWVFLKVLGSEVKFCLEKQLHLKSVLCVDMCLISAEQKKNHIKMSHDSRSYAVSRMYFTPLSPQAFRNSY